MPVRFDFGVKWREVATVIVDEIATLAQRPRAFAAAIEEKSPWLSHRLLSLTSSFIEPFLLGLGLRVERVSEDSAEVVMPRTWRSLGEGGTMHAAALSALGEFSSRLFWEIHLDLDRSDLTVRTLDLKILNPPRRAVRAVFRVPVVEREAVMYRLRAEGSADAESQVAMYDQGGRLVAEVGVGWTFQKRQALTAAVTEEADDV